MYEKFIKIILNTFCLFLFVPAIVMAMELSEEDSEKSPRLTGRQLREKVKPVKESWWESVEVITPCEEWKARGGEKKWNNSFKREICCFCSTRRNANDLVILEENRWQRSPVMFLKDAAKIMERENEETEAKYRETINEIRKKEVENAKEYKEEKQFLNYKDATYKNGSLGYWTGPFREYPKDRINPKIMEDLKKADADKRERERREKEENLSKSRRAAESYRQDAIAKEEAEAKAYKKAETERKHLIYLKSFNDSPETKRRKYWDWKQS